MDDLKPSFHYTLLQTMINVYNVVLHLSALFGIYVAALYINYPAEMCKAALKGWFRW